MACALLRQQRPGFLRCSAFSSFFFFKADSIVFFFPMSFFLTTLFSRHGHV